MLGCRKVGLGLLRDRGVTRVSKSEQNPWTSWSRKYGGQSKSSV